MFQLHFKRNTSGKYIIPHISLYQTFLKTIKLWVDISLKQHLVIIECDQFYKIALLIMEKGVWFILVVWSVWSCLRCGYCCVVDIVVLLLLLCYWYYVLIACEDNSSVVLILKLGHTWQQIGGVTWIKTNPLKSFKPKLKS